MLNLVSETTVRRLATMALESNWPEARTAPLLEQHERDLLCACLRSNFPASFPGPAALASRAGVGLVEAPVDGVVWTESLVLYQAQADDRMTGLLVYFGLAGVMLQRTRLPYRVGDQWSLTLDCCLPASILRASGAAFVGRVQPHVPLWLISARVEMLRATAVSIRN